MTSNEIIVLGLISTAGQLIQNLVLSDETKFSKYWTEDNLQWKKTSNGRRPQILKLKYLSNYWLDLS
jgi:hypothetical protein